MNFRLGIRRISLLSLAIGLLQGCAELGPQAPVVPAPRELLPLQAEIANLPLMEFTPDGPNGIRKAGLRVCGRAVR